MAEHHPKYRTPALSVIVPPKLPTAPSRQISQRFSPRGTTTTTKHTLQAHLEAVAAPKQKRLFLVVCRLVPTDQWFTTRIDRTWKVIDLKLWLLSKALPHTTLPLLPASFRPSSPITFASAPPAPPRPSTSASYHGPAAPQTPPAPHASSSAPSSPNPPTFSPSTSPPQVISSPPPMCPSPSSPSMRRYSLDSEEEMPLYANPYGAASDVREDADDDDLGRAAQRSIPYSFNTGAPAISGLEVLRSIASKASAGRGFVPGAGIDSELVRKADDLVKRWGLYSYSTGMLLSDDLPLSEYDIRPYELLELHRAGAYVRLPRTVFPECASVPECTLYTSDPPALSAPQASARAYHSQTTRKVSPHEPRSNADISDSDDGHHKYQTVVSGTSYAQPYFDGSVWVLVGGIGSAAVGSGEVAAGEGGGDVEGVVARRMRRRTRARSEAARMNKGKERAHIEAEWTELPSEPGIQRDEDKAKEGWRRRWVAVREGMLTIWKARTDETPDTEFEVAACVGLYDAEKLSSILASPSSSSAASTPLTSTTSTSSLISAPTPSHLKHVVCARFRAAPTSRSEQVERPGSKGAKKAPSRNGAWLILRFVDESTHEHFLRIFHRLAYSSPLSDPTRPSTASSKTHSPHTRTLRTDFLPNPIPQPLSLSFSPPSPVVFSDDAPGSPLNGMGSSESGDLDDEWVDDGVMWRRTRRKASVASGAQTMGLGRGMGVRFPEWRESVLRRAIVAGQGKLVEDVDWRQDQDAVDEETPRGDASDMYGFGKEEATNGIATYLDRNDYDSDDADSDTLSEAEWDGWAYDLDRPKAVEENDAEIGAGIRRKRVLGGLKTPQGSPASDEHEPAAMVDGGEASVPIHMLRRRARSFTTDSAVQMVTVSASSPGSDSLSPASATTPTTPGSRLRASTMSVHPRNPALVHLSETTLVSPRFAGARNARNLEPQPDEMTSVQQTVDTGTPGGGVRSLMRGLSMRAGRESFLRGLENALDFVEGR